jgi:hypothetical protein
MQKQAGNSNCHQAPDPSITNNCVSVRVRMMELRCTVTAVRTSPHCHPPCGSTPWALPPSADLLCCLVLIIIILLILHGTLCSNNLRFVLVLPLLTQQVRIGLQELGDMALKVQVCVAAA